MSAAVSTHRGRQRGAVALVILACILAPIAGTAVWVRNQVVDSDRYVRTVTPLASEPAVRAAIATEITTALFRRVDVVEHALEALPPRASFLAVPLAAGLRTATERAVARMLASPQFEQV